MKLLKIKIHFSVIILLILAMFTGFLNQMLILAFVLIAHELGHLFWLYLFKIRVRKIEFTLVGGLLDIEERPLSVPKQLCVAFGRPR